LAPELAKIGNEPANVSMSTPATFQEAIATSAEWIRLWDAEELSDEVLAELVGKLVTERDGARGFFVAALTGDSPLMDRLPEALILQLRQVGDGIVDLTARNLAMSTAMSIQHQRDNNQSLREGSLTVQRRSKELLSQLEPELVRKRLTTMLLGLEGKSEDMNFFERWGYDQEQKDAIKQILLSVAD
jgi:hypothetical protein